MKITPLFDRVVLETGETENQTAGGLFLSDASKDKSQMAKVIAVGPGGIIDGKEIKMQVKVGDLVLYSQYAGSKFKFENKEVIIIRQSDILAVVNKEA